MRNSVRSRQRVELACDTRASARVSRGGATSDHPTKGHQTMGTRGFMGVVIDGEMKIGYMHWDSYPDGVGKDVLETLRALLLVDTNDDVAKLARGLKVVKQDTPPTAAEKAE